MMKEELIKKAYNIRETMVTMYDKAGMGHITSGFSCLEILIVLYYCGILRYDSTNPEWSGRDYFIMSKGHGSTSLYPILADCGFFKEEELYKLLSEDSYLGLCLNGKVPGVELTTGSLSIGFGTAMGIALANKMDRKQNLTFVMIGDGECYEGAMWESALFAGHYHLNNLVAILDRNYMTVTDFTENMMKLSPLADKWKAFGWDVIEINGHSYEEIVAAFDGIRQFTSDRPKIIIADTVKGKGVDFIENVPLMHGNAVTGECAIKAKEYLEKQYECTKN